MTKQEAEQLFEEINWIGVEFYPLENTDKIKPLDEYQINAIWVRIKTLVKGK